MEKQDLATSAVQEGKSSPNQNIAKVKPYIIGISGGSASGKTSVAEMIFKLIGIQECIMISMDSYYKDLT